MTRRKAALAVIVTFANPLGPLSLGRVADCFIALQLLRGGRRESVTRHQRPWTFPLANFGGLHRSAARRTPQNCKTFGD